MVSYHAVCSQQCSNNIMTASSIAALKKKIHHSDNDISGRNHKAKNESKKTLSSTLLGYDGLVQNVKKLTYIHSE